MNVLALIPARAGSKGVRGKNVRELAGHPLIAYSIAAAHATAGIGRIIVSTDSKDIADVARSYGAEVPFLRPAHLAQDVSPDQDFLVHALDWLREHENGEEPDVVVHLRPTTPLRDHSLLTNSLNAFLSCGDATSLRSSHRAPESPLKWFRLDDKGFYLPLVGDDLSSSNLPRQSFPQVFIPNGYVDLLRPDVIRNAETIHGRRILHFETPWCVEIDTEDDFRYLEYSAKFGHWPIIDRLNSINSKR